MLFRSGHFVAAGVYVDAGSRYEGDRTRGAGHMTDRLGFKVSPLTCASGRACRCGDALGPAEPPQLTPQVRIAEHVKSHGGADDEGD